ncbi:transmembrane channel-like protein 8, partial [Tupaia chinensis]|uniref:transmembrane channel-like protein 8 n=1 Tax=Tupaia chinensis TaxID=246437 RepID=UPI000FFB15B9
LARGFGLWEGALYEIGGLFGTGIQSYFTFLRFLLLLNLLTLLLTTGFVLLPLAWLRPPAPGPALNLTLHCPRSHGPQTGAPKFHNQLWNVLTGRAFNNTYLFYGGYRAGPERSSAYSIRLAYLLSPLACLLLCFCGTLQRMVKGLPQKPLLGPGYRAPLSAKVFSSWDFCIRVQEAATIKKHEISNEFKVELQEAQRFLQKQQQSRSQRVCHLITYLRVNVLMGLLVAGAISAIFWATKYSQDNKEEPLFVLLQYLPPGVIALVNFLGPLLFVFLVQQENYPPSTEVNLTLVWCVVLKLASLAMFSFSLGQTMLCVGTKKTSCEPYGYNACDYQCWENAVGEEMYKLGIFNFLLTVAFTFLVSLPRRLLVDRFPGRFWAWLGREEFLVPKNVLDIVTGQTVTWMGLFYCPLLPLLNGIFIFLTFYIKRYTLLRNSRASPRLFRASSSTFFFQLVLLLGLLLAAGPLGYVVSSVHSSWDCGLFTNYSAPWQVVPELVALRLPPTGQRILQYLGSHAFSFPLLVLLSLVLTVCISQSQANARAIQGLRKQLVWQVQDSNRVQLPDSTRETSIAYEVLKVFPKGRQVLITCHAPQAPPPVTYSLWGTHNIRVARKEVKTQGPASFSINVTLKSRPDLLTYSCQAASTLGLHAASSRLQLYWELWTSECMGRRVGACGMQGAPHCGDQEALPGLRGTVTLPPIQSLPHTLRTQGEPVSQLQANFTLQDRGAGPRVELSCQARSGSPPITYSLVGKDGQVHMQQTPLHGQPASFSFPPAQAAGWLQCQAENSVSIQGSAFTLVPPGELPLGPTLVLAGSLTSTAAVTSGMLGWTMRTSPHLAHSRPPTFPTPRSQVPHPPPLVPASPPRCGVSRRRRGERARRLLAAAPCNGGLMQCPQMGHQDVLCPMRALSWDQQTV